ncbi:hypothetical protein LAZ67_8000633 [Cordylochernes scorpioides]|uniref:Mos1 transposase HTH domain-containing protein n=1 Tax=Cordylochernes scorpioides TaxID=51811 RepID=A0ABY6KQ48_9ARAC|nr:hypothetical protein LAZ67_8000633 [Cordylochernes scorpioides]
MDQSDVPARTLEQRFIDRIMLGLIVQDGTGRSKSSRSSSGICNVHGKCVIGERAAQKWFAKFKNGDLDLEDTPRSGRPSELMSTRTLRILCHQLDKLVDLEQLKENFYYVRHCSIDWIFCMASELRETSNAQLIESK